MRKESSLVSYGQSRLSLIDRITSQLRIKKVVKILKAMSKKDANDLNVLELGCGYNGENIQRLAKYFPKFIFEGIDLQVNPYVHSSGVTLISGDIATWKTEKQYDIVLSLAVIEHLSDPLQHLKLIHSLLKPEGVAILTSPAPPSHFLWLILKSLRLIDTSLGNEHIIYLTKSGIVQLSQKSGLRIVRQASFELGLNQLVVFNREKGN